MNLMAKNKVVVQDSKGNRLVVQPSQIPQGYNFVEEYEEPRKVSIKPKNSKK